MILWELAGDIWTGAMERRVASLLMHHVLIKCTAREDPCVILMAIEEAPTERHCHVGLTAGEILHHHLVWAHGVDDTSPGFLQLVVRAIITIRVW